MSFPTVTVEFSPGTGPLDTPVWVDISDRVLSLEWTVGRQRDLAEWPAGEATVVLRNDDRLFDPDHTSGTYYGDLLPRVPFRIRATANDPVLDGGEYVLEDGQPVTDGTVTYDLFYGFVEDGWEQTYQPPAVSTCTVDLVDLLAVLEGYTLPSVLAAEILADNPVAYWPLDEDSGNSLRDLSGNGYHGTYQTGSTSLSDTAQTPAGHRLRGLTFDGEHYGTVSGAYDALLDALLPPVVIELVATRPSVDGYALAFGTGNILQAERWFRAQLDADGGVTMQANGPAIGRGKAESTGAVTHTDRPVHLAFEKVNLANDADMYVDGAAVTVSHLNPTSADALPATVYVGSTKNGESPLVDAFVSSIAIFNTNIGAARIAAHAAAAMAPLDGLRSDEQVDWILGTVGVPAALIDLDQGITVMGPLDSAGRNALEVLREIAATEQAALYVDHGAGGKIRFRSRYHSWLDTAATTTQATFSDDTTVDYNHVEPGSLVLEANGVGSIINRVTVSWAGGEITAEDAASVAAYGPRSVSIRTQAPTPAVAQGIGEWIVATNAQPRSRIRGFSVNPGSEQAGYLPALSLRIGDRVTFRHHPQEEGSAVTRDLEVLGATHKVDGVDWWTDWYVTDAPKQEVELFLLGSSEMGGTHVLAY